MGADKRCKLSQEQSKIQCKIYFRKLCKIKANACTKNDRMPSNVCLIKILLSFNF